MDLTSIPFRFKAENIGYGGGKGGSWKDDEPLPMIHGHPPHEEVKM